MKTNNTTAVAMKGLPVEISRIPHFQDDVGREGAYAGKQAVGNLRLVTRNQDNRHGFPDRPAHAEHNASHNPRTGRRQRGEKTLRSRLAPRARDPS